MLWDIRTILKILENIRKEAEIHFTASFAITLNITKKLVYPFLDITLVNTWDNTDFIFQQIVFFQHNIDK